MAIITKVEVQKKDKNRVNLYIDEEFYCGLDLDTCVKYGLKKDLELSDEKLKIVIFDAQKNDAFNKSVNYLGSALKTKKQLRDYLKKKEFSEEIIEYVIEKMVEYRYLDDAHFVDSYYKTYKNKYGNNKMKYNLISKGVSKTIVEEYFDNLEEDNSEVLYNLALKKLGNKEKTRENLDKVYRFLVSRGFDFDEVTSVIKKLKED